MKLHLPARLRAALLACCSVACTISPFLFSATPVYALTAVTTDAVKTYTSGGKSATFDDKQYENYTNAWVQLNGGANGSAASVSSSGKPIVVGGEGGIFLQNWGQGSIVLDNDMYVMDAPVHTNVIQFGNDGGINETTTLNGNFYVLESIVLNSRGSAAINFNGLMTDKVAIDGTATEGGTTLTFGVFGNLSNKGYHIAGGANLTNVVVGLSHAEVSISSDVTLTGKLTNQGTINQNSGNVRLNGSVLEAGRYNLKGGNLSSVTFAEGSKLAVADGVSLGNVSFSGGTLDVSSISQGDSAALTVAGKVSFSSDSQINLASGLTAGSTYVLFDGTDNLEGWESLDSDNFYVASNDYTTGKVSLDVEITSTGFKILGSKTTYTVGGKSATFDDKQYANYTNAWVQLNGGANGSAASVSSSEKPIVVGGRGGIFLQNWGQGSIVLDNDMYVMDAPVHINVIQFGNDGGINETTTLNGNFYVLESLALNSRGSAAINFNGLMTDKVAIDGTATEGGTTLTFGISGHLSNKGYHIAGGANLTNVVVGLSHAEVSISSDVTLTGTLSNQGTIRQTDGAVQLNHSVLEDGVYKLEGGSLSKVTFAAGSGLSVSREATLADVSIAGGVLDLSASSVVGQPVVQTSGRVSFDTTSLILLNMEGAELNTVYEVFDNAANVTGWDSLSLNNLEIISAGALKHGASVSLGGNSIAISDFGVNYTDMSTSGSGNWDYRSAIWTSATHSPETPIKFAAGDSVVFSESASLTVRDTGVTAGAVLVNNGATLALSGGNLVVQEGMIIGNGATVTLNTTKYGHGAIQGEVTVQDGGTLQLNTKDVTGYNGGSTTMHTLRVEEGGKVVLNFSADNVNETFAGTLYLDGTLSGTGTWDFYGGSCLITGENKEAAISTNIRLRRNDATLSVGAGSTLTLTGALYTNEGNGRMVKTGDGRLDIASTELRDNMSYRIEEGTLEFSGGVGVSTVEVAGGTLELTNSCSVKKINMVSAESEVTFAGGDGSVYNVDVLSSKNSASFARDITVNEGIELNVTSFENTWGVGTVQVDGVLNVSDTLLMSSGTNTTGNRISGSGVANVENLVLQNIGSYYFDVATLNVGNATLNRMMYVEGGTVNVSGEISSASGYGVALSGDSKLCLKENSSVKLNALSLADSAAISLGKNAVLDLTTMGNYDDDDSARFSELLNSTSGEGTLKANLSGEFRMAEDTEVNTNVELAGLTINCYNSKNHSLVVDNGSLSLSGTLTLQSTANMQIDGGSVQVAAVKLGHSSAGNPGHLKLYSGSLVAGEISLTSDNDAGNTFVMTGGVLEITGSAGIAEGVETSITGGVLKAESADWSISGASVGGVTVMGSKTLELCNTTLTSCVSNQGNLTLSGTLAVNDLSGFGAELSKTYSDGENGYRTTTGAFRLFVNDGVLNMENVSLVGELTGGILTSDGMVTFANTDNDTYWVNTEVDAAEVRGVTLGGDGVYRISNVSAIGGADGLSLSADWTGTVIIKDCTSKGIELKDFANASSRLVVDGLSGWFGGRSSNHVYVNTLLELEAGGLCVTDSSQWAYHFEGGISGVGDFVVATKKGEKPTYTFRGDMSAWDGAFRVQPSAVSSVIPDVTVELLDGGTIFSGEDGSGIYHERLGKLFVSVGNSSEKTVVKGDIWNAGVTVDGVTDYGILNLTANHETTFDGVVEVTKLTLGAGAVVTFNASLSADTVVIGKDASLSSGTNSVVSMNTLSGSGTYYMGAITQFPVLADDWTGTWSVRNAELAGTNFDDWGNAKSTVELSGVSGYLSRADDGDGLTCYTNLRLIDAGTQYAYSMTDGYRDDIRIYAGSVSGTGSYARATSNCGIQTLIFSGDVSGWSGYLRHVPGSDTGMAGNAVTYATFNGSREINVNMVTDEYGEFHVTLDDENLAEGSNTVTLKGNVKADSLTVTDGTKTVLESSVNVQKLVVAGSAELAGQAAITVDTVTVHAADGEGEKRIALADLSLTGLAGYGREAAVASLISVTARNDFSFSDISLTGVEFSAENTELSLNNVRLSQDCSFSVGSLGSIQLDSVLLDIVLPGLSSSADGILELDCSNLFHCVVNGELDVVLDVDTAELLAAGYRNVTLDLGEDVTYGELTINLAGATYTGNSNGLAQFSLNVPEPGTVTLSLLALASLAARRRRR